MVCEVMWCGEAEMNDLKEGVVVRGARPIALRQLKTIDLQILHVQKIIFQ